MKIAKKLFGNCATALLGWSVVACSTTPPPEPQLKEAFGPPQFLDLLPTPNEISEAIAGKNYRCVFRAPQGGGLNIAAVVTDPDGELQVVEIPSIYFTHSDKNGDMRIAGTFKKGEDLFLFVNDKAAKGEFAQIAVQYAQYAQSAINVCLGLKWRAVHGDTTLKDVKTVITSQQLVEENDLFDGVPTRVAVSTVQAGLNAMKDTGDQYHPR